MAFTVRNGDMFSTPAQAYIQGVNCMGVMGAGVAAKVAELFPYIKDSYRVACLRGDLTPGGVHYGRINDEDAMLLGIPDGADSYMINAASQNMPGADAQEQWMIDSLRESFTLCANLSAAKINLPLIGGGIGGIRPDRAQTIIERVANEYPELDITLWLYVPPARTV